MARSRSNKKSQSFNQIMMLVVLALGLAAFTFVVRSNQDTRSSAKMRKVTSVYDFWSNSAPSPSPDLYTLSNWTTNIVNNYEYMLVEDDHLKMTQGSTTKPYFFYPASIGAPGIPYYDGNPVYAQVYGYITATNNPCVNDTPFVIRPIWINSGKYDLQSNNHIDTWPGWTDPDTCWSIGGNEYAFAIEGLYAGSVNTPVDKFLFGIVFYPANSGNKVFRFHKITLSKEPVTLIWPPPSPTPVPSSTPSPLPTPLPTPPPSAGPCPEGYICATAITCVPGYVGSGNGQQCGYGPPYFKQCLTCVPQ